MKIAAAFAALCLTSCQVAPSDSGLISQAPSPSDYQPLRTGDRWTYQFRSEFAGQPVQYRVKTVTVGEGEQGASSFIDEKGDYYLFTCDENDLQLHGEREEGEIHTFSPPFVYLRRGMIEGKIYETQNKSSEGADIRCEARYLGRLEEKTPGGTFPDCIRADFRYHLPTGNSFWIETTLARGVGPVRKRFALEGKNGKTLARFEQELLSARLAGVTQSKDQNLSANLFSQAARHGHPVLRLESTADSLRLRGFEEENAATSFASPVLLLLQEMKPDLPYRSTVKDVSGEKWEITTLLREPTAPKDDQGSAIDVELRIANKNEERSWALRFDETRGLAASRTLSWNRTSLRPAAYTAWRAEGDGTQDELSPPFGDDAMGRSLLRNAHASRAVWPAAFAGYSANFRLEIENPARTHEGRVLIRTKGKPHIEGPGGEDGAWLEREIVSIVSHRRHEAESVGREPRGKFAIEKGSPLGQIHLRLLGDPMDSAWTIEEGRVARVRRKEIGGSFEIEVLEIERDANGRYVPRQYRVRHFGKEGNLTSWEDYQDRFEWHANAPILQSRTIEFFDLSGTPTGRKRLTFDKIKIENDTTEGGTHDSVQ